MRFALSVALLLAAFTAVAHAETGPAEEYIDAQLRVVGGLEARLDSIADAADRTAKGLMTGGQIYLAGEPGMIAELLGRAGGLCAAKALAPGKPWPKFRAGDVVLLSDYGLPKKPTDHSWKELTQSGVLVVAFASAANPMLAAPLPANVVAIPVDIPLESCLMTGASARGWFPRPPRPWRSPNGPTPPN